MMTHNMIDALIDLEHRYKEAQLTQAPHKELLELYLALRKVQRQAGVAPTQAGLAHAFY